jgi:hypothetical protein
MPPKAATAGVRHRGSYGPIGDISHCGKLPATSGQSTDVRRGVPHRGEHRRAAKRAAADIEGHSAATELGEPRRLIPERHGYERKAGRSFLLR